MKCPLCNAELFEQEVLDPNTGQTLKWQKCPVILKLTRIYNGKYTKSTTHHYDTSHYWFGNQAEIAYAPPYRIHNVFSDGHCEVSFCPIELSYPPYHETYIIFKSPIIKITDEKQLLQRIKTLALFS